MMFNGDSNRISYGDDLYDLGFFSWFLNGLIDEEDS
jgi:hypothetical protein